jgi:hypothetical protein
VEDQTVIINELKLYIQDIEDLYKHATLKLANIPKLIDENTKNIGLQDTILEIKLKISKGKKDWIKRLSYLED